MKKKLNDWVYEWLETYKKVMVKPSTYDSYLQYATHITVSYTHLTLPTNSRV